MRNELRIKVEGGEVLIIQAGRLVGRLPPHAATEVADALRSAAKIADEFASRDQIIRDTAILTRAGFRLGLTNRPDFKAEAGRLAAWGRDLRRYMPGGVKSREVFGVPTITNHGVTK